MKIKIAGIAAVPTSWQDVILVCGKCSKKLHGGFGPDGDDSLARALKHELRTTGRRRSVRVIETKCLGLCPKGAVTVLPARQPGAMLAVPRGTEPAAVLARIATQVDTAPSLTNGLTNGLTEGLTRGDLP